MNQILPVVNRPYLNKMGMVPSNYPNDGSESGLLLLSPGVCRSSDDTFDIVIDEPIIVDIFSNGINGLDRGSFAENTMYAIYAVADPQGYMPSGYILTNADNAYPSIPVPQYGVSRLIAYWATRPDGSGFLKGTYNGYYNDLEFFYYQSPPTLVQNGTQTGSYALVSTKNNVPPVDAVATGVLGYYTATAGQSVFLQNGDPDLDFVPGNVYTAQATGVSLKFQTTVCSNYIATPTPGYYIQYTMQSGTLQFLFVRSFRISV